MNKTLRFAAMPLALFTGSALAEMSCSALGSQLATQPSVLQVSAAIPLTQVIGTRCEANFVYSSRGGPAHGYAVGQDQRIVLRVGLPLNAMDNTGGSLWKARCRTSAAAGW